MPEPDEIELDPGRRQRVVAEAIRRGRRLRQRRRAVIGGLAVGVIAAATAGGVALAAPGHGPRPTPLEVAPVGAPSAVPTSDGSTSTSATQATSTTSVQAVPPPVSAPATTVEPSPSTDATTTTTVPPVPPCTTAQLVFTISIPSTSYPPGATIPITGTLTNTGSACQDTQNETSGCWTGDLVATNQAGQVVWQDYAETTVNPLVTSCPAEVAGGFEVPAGSSESFTRTWAETDCVYDTDPSAKLFTPNPDCPDTQVPAGTYSISSDSFTSAASQDVQITGG